MLMFTIVTLTLSASVGARRAADVSVWLFSVVGMETPTCVVANPVGNPVGARNNNIFHFIFFCLSELFCCLFYAAHYPSLSVLVDYRVWRQRACVGKINLSRSWREQITYRQTRGGVRLGYTYHNMGKSNTIQPLSTKHIQYDTRVVYMLSYGSWLHQHQPCVLSSLWTPQYSGHDKMIIYSVLASRTVSWGSVVLCVVVVWWLGFIYPACFSVCDGRTYRRLTAPPDGPILPTVDHQQQQQQQNYM